MIDAAAAILIIFFASLTGLYGVQAACIAWLGMIVICGVYSLAIYAAANLFDRILTRMGIA